MVIVTYPWYNGLALWYTGHATHICANFSLTRMDRTYVLLCASIHSPATKPFTAAYSLAFKEFRKEWIEFTIEQITDFLEVMDDQSASFWFATN